MKTWKEIKNAWKEGKRLSVLLYFDETPNKYTLITVQEALQANLDDPLGIDFVVLKDILDFYARIMVN